MDPVMKILHLIDSFDCDSSARQLQLLGPKLMQTDCVEVCCLGPETPAFAAMRRAGVMVHALDWTRWIDPSVLWNLRAVLDESTPDIIHVWRLPALRALALASKSALARTIVSASLPGRGKLAWWDRWLLDQVQCVAMAGSDEEACLERHDIRNPILRIVPPAIACDDWEKNETRKPASIVYMGRLDRNAGARHAVWAFDIVRHLFPDARLQMIGTETTSTTVRDLADGLQVAPYVTFHGARADVNGLLREASVVWLPRLENRGRQSALDAMAQGRVVIASDVPCMREVIRDRETGFLVPVGSVMEIARRTRFVLQDADLREQMENAARQTVEQRFALNDTVSQWRDLYRTVAA